MRAAVHAVARPIWGNRSGTVVEAVATVVVGILFIAFIGQSGYRQDLALLVIVYSLLALGMYVPLVLAGDISLAYNAYFAIGAYVVAVMANDSGWNLLLAVPIAAALSALTAAVLSFVTRNLSGFYLAVATLMFGVAAQRFLIQFEGITGGASGLGIGREVDAFGAHLDRTVLIVLGVVAVWLVALMVSRMRGSLIGVALRVQREAWTAATAAGVPTSALKVIALAGGAAIASLAGWFFATVNGFVLPDSFSTSIVFLVVFMPIFGGTGSPWGAVIGAGLVVIFTQAFDFLAGPGMLTFAVLALFVLLVAPSGILGLGRTIGVSLGRLIGRRADAHSG